MSGRRRQRPDKAQGAPVASTADQVLREAETLQQRAERRKGQEAIPCYEQAASMYDQALQMGLPAEQQSGALLGLGECLQMWADTVTDVCRKLPDAQLTPAVEQQAEATARALYERSVAAYQQATAGQSDVQEDAHVNCGNTLCSWSQLLSVRESLPLLQQAVTAYQTALTQVEDAPTLSNLADALVQTANALCETENTQQVGALCTVRQHLLLADDHRRRCAGVLKVAVAHQ